MSAFTDVHAEHAVAVVTALGGVVCGCTQRFGDRHAHAAHVEVELAKAGIAITQLPEPDEDTGAFDAGCGAITHAVNGDVRLHSASYVSGRYGGIYRSPAKARELAAALLAAAASIPTKETPNA